MHDYICELQESDKYIVSELRRSQYKKTYGQNIDECLFNWGPTDRVSTVFGAFSRDRLISTLRLETINSNLEFETKLTVNLMESSLKFPVACTSRAATLPEFQGRGLHHILKMYCIIKARELGIKNLYTVVKSDSFQVGPLKRLGYEFMHFKHLEARGFFTENTNVVLGYLNLPDRGDLALSYIQKKYAHTIDSFSSGKTYQEEFR